MHSATVIYQFHIWLQRKLPGIWLARQAHSNSFVKSFSVFNNVSSSVSSEESPGRGGRAFISMYDNLSSKPRNTQIVKAVNQQVLLSSDPWLGIVTVCQRMSIYPFFLNSNHLGDYSSWLSCLIDITLIRITLHEHDRWKSSGYTHNPTDTHVRRRWSTYTLALYKQMESEVIFFLRGTWRQDVVSGAREGQLAL